MSASPFTSFAYGNPSMPAAPEKDLLYHLSNLTLPISPRARAHLTKVYSTLALTIAFAAVGCLAHLRYHVGGTLTHVLSFVLIMAISATSMSSSQPSASSWVKGVPNALLLLCALGFCQGASLGPLVQMAVYVDPSLVLTAFVLTANVFVCFSLTALFIPRRSQLALASVLSSSLSFLLCLSLLSLVFPTVWAYKVQLYLGLLVFCGYIIIDTQAILDAAESGRADYIRDALKLCMDVVAVFVRLLVILIENAAKKDEGERRKRTTVRR